MRAFSCASCGAAANFTNARCDCCGSLQGYLPYADDLLSLRALNAGVYVDASSADPQGYWRCLNSAWGCNWILPAQGAHIWCASCRLTRSRPDTGRHDAIAVWAKAERAKRRLIRELLELRLPVESAASQDGNPPTPDAAEAPSDDCLLFDLVHLPDNPGMTGHRRGVITLDLREVEDQYRARIQRGLGEPDRTVIGHLRHEAGHHYWEYLVAWPRDQRAFRSLFGDERADYSSSLTAHYAQTIDSRAATHITHYASAHPAEDWAETFAHYLTMRAVIETSDARGVHPIPARAAESADTLIRHWRDLSSTLNEIAHGFGHLPLYPYTITDLVAAKLGYVHERVQCVTHSSNDMPG